MHNHREVIKSTLIAHKKHISYCYMACEKLADSEDRIGQLFHSDY